MLNRPAPHHRVHSSQIHYAECREERREEARTRQPLAQRHGHLAEGESEGHNLWMVLDLGFGDDGFVPDAVARSLSGVLSVRFRVKTSSQGSLPTQRWCTYPWKVMVQGVGNNLVPHNIVGKSTDNGAQNLCPDQNHI